MADTEKKQENRVRGLARRRGFRVSKSRQQQHFNNQGKYMLANDRNYVVLGDRYDASLEVIEAYIRAQEE